MIWRSYCARSGRRRGGDGGNLRSISDASTESIATGSASDFSDELLAGGEHENDGKKD